MDEKDRRIYYQDIVYKVCNALDKLTPGKHIVCGTIEEPSTDVQDRVEELVKEISRRTDK